MELKTLEISVNIADLYLYSTPTPTSKKMSDSLSEKQFQIRKGSFCLEIHSNSKCVHNFLESNLLLNNLKKYLIANVKNLHFRNISKFCIIGDDNISEDYIMIFIKYLTKEE